MWKQRIKDMLIKVVLYQHGKYPAEKLDKELTEFLRDAEKELCKAIRRNGGVCYKEALEDMTPKEAEDYVEDQIRNFETLGKTGEIIADLLRLSLEFRDLDKMGLRDKILLFDKVVHAEHTAGAFKGYLAEEKSIFGVNITRIKGEADKEVEKILKGKEKAPDPQEEERRRRVRMSKREALTRIRRDVEIALRDQGYTAITKALSYIRPELESLAEEVVEGRMSVEEAVERGLRLARQYATPPKPAPPRVPPEERVPPKPSRKFEYRGVVIYLDDIMQAWEDVLEKGLSQALREITFGYLPKRGVEEFTKWWVAQVRVKEPKSFREWLFRNPPWDVLLWRALFTYGATGYFWALIEDVYNKYEDQLLGLDVSTFDKFKQLIIEYLVNFRP